MADRVELYRTLKLGSRGYDVDGAKRCVYRLLGRRNGSRWAYYVGMGEVQRKTFGPRFVRHCDLARDRLAVERGKRHTFDQYLLNALYAADAVDWISERLFEQARPSKVCPIPEGVAFSIIGYPGQGTHNAYDWQSRNALDWKAAAGTPILAPITGRVERAGGTNGIRYSGGKIIFGQKFTIDPPSGPSCFLTHLANMTVRDGQLVSAGDVVGSIGNYGPGSHLHCALEYGDPQAMLEWARIPLDV